MKANGQYEKGDKIKRGDCEVVIEQDETDAEYAARMRQSGDAAEETAPPVKKGKKS